VETEVDVPPVEGSPAPVVAEEEDDGKPRVILPDDMKDKISIEMEEIDDDGNVVVQHDEL